MNLTGIWIKAISLVIIAITTFICAIFAYKKFNWKQYELIFVLIIGIVILIFGFKNISFAVNPTIEKIYVNYIYQSSNGIIFGREYHFVDKNGNNYDLTMDPITANHIFKNKEFNSDTVYVITYEKNSNTIVGIEGKTGDGTVS